MTCSEFANLVDSYLKEEISPKKREHFEAHYFECDHCFADLKLRERLYSKEVPVVLKGKKPFWVWGLKPLLVLSSFLFVVVLSFVVINNYKEAKYLYEISDVEAPAYMQSETRRALQDETFRSAMSLYNNKQYTEALKLLNAVNGGSANPQVLFFKGICSLQTDDPKSAIKRFDVIIKNMNPSYYDEAIFYKGIALLRLNKKKQSLEQFNNLASMFSPYSKKAKALIGKIRKR